jgi:hypothetical protein
MSSHLIQLGLLLLFIVILCLLCYQASGSADRFHRAGHRRHRRNPAVSRGAHRIPSAVEGPQKRSGHPGDEYALLGGAHVSASPGLSGLDHRPAYLATTGFSGGQLQPAARQSGLLGLPGVTTAPDGQRVGIRDGVVI